MRPLRFALGVAVIAGGGCGRATPAPAPVVVAGPEVPDWVLRTPSPRGEVCAVGAVDRTFFTQDAHRQAAEAARTELAKTIEVRVESVMVDYQSTRGGWVRSSDVVSVVESVAEGVLHGAEVRATWRDEEGAHLAPGMTYALACLRTDVPVEQLAQALKAAGRGEDADDVRERARDAFDELSRMESEKASEGLNKPEGPSVPRPEEVQ